MMRKIWIGVLVLCLTLCASACAEGSLFSGAGTEENPYQIATAEDLAQLAAALNDDNLYADYNYAHYQLTDDVELNDVSAFDAWETTPPANNWTPIGYYHTFHGVFDGNGHTVSGLYISRPVAKDAAGHESYQFGLFGRMDGEIRDLTIRNAFVHAVKGDGMSYPPEAGILAGSNGGLIRDCGIEGVVICSSSDNGGIVASNYGEIDSCTFSGRMIERNGDNHYQGGSIGGIAGSGGNIRNCSVNAQIISEKNLQVDMCGSIGGIVGLFSSFNETKSVEDCTFAGEIIGGSYAGGIVGHAGVTGKIDEPVQTVVRGCTNSGSVASDEDAGGIVGLVLHSSKHGEILVENCANLGSVSTLESDMNIYAAGGVVGSIDSRNAGSVTIAGCTNEMPISAYLPGGVVGRAMQMKGRVRVENCVNKGAITGEGTYAGGVLCHIQQLGDEWNIEVVGCTNEGDISVKENAGGIVCFAFSTDGKNASMAITDCVNRGNLTSDGINNFMGGILGVNAMAKTPVTLSGCTNEGSLEYTRAVQADAETLSGMLFTLSRTSGGIVGYVGFAPYLSVNSGEREENNINAKKAWMTIENCASTGSFVHQEAVFADDVDAAFLEELGEEGRRKVLNFFPALEGGIVGTIADSKDYSVKITGCTYENIDREYDDWNRFQ